MSDSRIEPEKITKPIQLLAAWFVALIVLVASFLGAAKTVDQPPWLPVLFGFAAASFVPFFALLVFRLQTKYRPELQEDRYYAKYQADRRQLVGFTPENLPGAPVPAGTTFTEDDGDLKKFRQDVYDRQRGLFLVHVWRPSTVPGQIADISLRLHEHGKVWKPLTDHLVERVDYYLGDYFFGGNIVSKTNAAENFRFDVSAYGTSCWVAKVYFNDGAPAALLERYIDFPL